MSLIKKTALLPIKLVKIIFKLIFKLIFTITTGILTKFLFYSTILLLLILLISPETIPIETIINKKTTSNLINSENINNILNSKEATIIIEQVKNIIGTIINKIIKKIKP